MNLRIERDNINMLEPFRQASYLSSFIMLNDVLDVKRQ